MHIDDPMDTEANISIDTMAAMSLKLHVNAPTDIKGNTLYLIYTELNSSLDVSKI